MAVGKTIALYFLIFSIAAETVMAQVSGIVAGLVSGLGTGPGIEKNTNSAGQVNTRAASIDCITQHYEVMLTNSDLIPKPLITEIKSLLRQIGETLKFAPKPISKSYQYDVTSAYLLFDRDLEMTQLYVRINGYDRLIRLGEPGVVDILDCLWSRIEEEKRKGNLKLPCETVIEPPKTDILVNHEAAMKNMVVLRENRAAAKRIGKESGETNLSNASLTRKDKIATDKKKIDKPLSTQNASNAGREDKKGEHPDDLQTKPDTRPSIE